MSTTTLPAEVVPQTSNQQGTESQTPATPRTDSSNVSPAPQDEAVVSPQPLTAKASIKDYKMKKRIGGGGEGAVYLATNVKQPTGEDMAIKCIICHAEEDAKTTRKELDFLLSLEHTNIVKHTTYWEEKHSSFLGDEIRFYLVMEFCVDGSLEDYIIQRKKESKPFTVQEIFNWTTQVCACMSYMHGNSIIHRDIKTDNILLKDGKSTVKVCDFGFTKKLGQVITGTVLGTVVYMAPEIFESKKYDESVDIWSLGVVIMQLALMKSQKEVADIRADIAKSRFFVRELLKGQDTKLISIAEACLRIDPIERPKADEIAQFIADPVATEIRKQKVAKAQQSTTKYEGSPLSLIENEKGKEFWKANGWSEKYEVDWLTFSDAYRGFMNWKRMSQEQSRGLKTLLCFVGSNNVEYVSCVTLNAAITSSGFPFNLSILYAIEKFREVSEENSGKRDYNAKLSAEEYAQARGQYLEMIVSHDKIFVDPISQEILSVDQHCAPLKLVTEEEWEALMKNEYDMDYEDDKLLRLERLGQARQASHHENAISYLVNIPHGHKYIILGAAASGKTCMMRLLMFKAAQRALENKDFLIPIFVPVANLANFPKTMEFKLKCIRASADSMYNKSLKYPDLIEHFLLTAIKQQKVLYLFDGLDEAASQEEKHGVQLQICKLQTNLNGFIITSRVSGFDSDEEGRGLFDDYTLGRVLPLNYETQKLIAEKRGVDDETFLKSLRGKYRELAKTPLLLSLMIQEFKQSKALPEIRADLYGQAIKTMISIFFNKTKPNMEAQQKKQERKEVRKLLLNMAVYLHKKRTRDFMTEDVNVESATPTTVSDRAVWDKIKGFIDDGKFGLVIGLNGKYRFSHLSFQEYFVAKAWSQSSESEIRGYERQWITFQAPKLNFIGERVKKLVLDPWYRETFLLCAGAMEKDDFLKFANFLLKLFKSQPHIIDSIMFNMIRERPEKERELYNDIIKTLNSQQKIKVILEGLIHQSEDLRQMALKRVKLYKDYPKIAKFLISHFGDTDGYASEQLSLVIPEGEQDTIQRLLLQLSSTKDVKIQARCCKSLGCIATAGNKEVAKTLLDIVKDTERAPEVRKAACEAISKVATEGDSAVVTCLCDLAQDPFIQSDVANALGTVSAPGDIMAIQKLMLIANNVEEALVALGKISKVGDQLVIKTMLDILQNNNSFEETTIFSAIEKVVDKDDNDKVVNDLIGMLSIRRRGAAFRAAMALGYICHKGDAVMFQRLIKLAENSTMRDKIACALGIMGERGDENVIQVLVKYVLDKAETVSVKNSAALSLGSVAKKGDTQVIQALCTNLEKEELLKNMAESLCAISEKDDEHVLNSFLQLLQYPDSGVVEKAVSFLGKIAQRGNQKVVNELLAQLDTPYEHVHLAVAESLASVATEQDEKVIAAMKNIVLDNNKSSYLRLAFLKSLGAVITTRSNNELVQSLLNMVLAISDTKLDAIKTEGVILLSKICDVGSMIELLKPKSNKKHTPVLFTIIVKAIRLLRDDKPDWKLEQPQVDVLQRMNTLESTFIFLT